MSAKYLTGLIIALLIGAAIGYAVCLFAGRSLTNSPANIASFEECVAAGYPVMESYPEQCRTADGAVFIRQIDEQPVPPFIEEGVMCTLEARECADGSFVGRVPPSCEFAPCPGE